MGTSNLNSASPLEAALIYCEKFGFSVIPVKPDKKPHIKWEPYQKQRATSDEIKSWWTRWPNAMIGVATGSISGVAVIDIDTQEGREAITRYIPDSLLTPTSKTPKGGQHLYFRSPDKPISNNARVVPGCDFRGEGGYVIAPPSINATGQAYKWLLSIEESEPADLPEPYILFISSLAVKVCVEQKQFDEDSHTKSQLVTGSHKILNLGRRDNDLFHVASSLIKNRTPINEVEQYLEILAKSCNPSFPISEVEEKIKSALKRVERKERNITEEVRQWVLVTDGHFEVTDYHRESQLVTKEEKHTANVALRRMVVEGLIEKFGDKRGVYRKVEKECDEIDFLNASDQTIDLHWPSEIECFVKILPKNIVVIAGSPDAGKSAFLFNVVRENMNRFKIHYFSSEMGAEEIKDRLKKFEMPLENWKRCSFKERSSNFSDVIVPNDINIIDFVEIHDEFWKVGGLLKEIVDKLIKGIAIVALQKKAGQDLGRGGLGTLEKPRLYLAIENGRIKIVKAKNWVDSRVNPNGLEVSFKLVDGCKFVNLGDWSKPAEISNLYHETPNQYKNARKRLGKEDLCKEFSGQFGE
jgi:hypothetical protein